jgi:hypothetical protein
LLKVPRFGAGYYDYVHNGPTLRLLWAAVNSVSSKIRVMVALHHDYSNKSIRGKALDWALRENARGVLGRKVEYPEEKIWDEPAQLITKASQLINSGKLTEASKLVTLAAFQAEWAARALDAYIAFVKAMQPGVSVALKVLQVAEKLGHIADAILLVYGGAGLIKRFFTRGASGGANAGANTVVKRPAPAPEPVPKNHSPDAYKPTHYPDYHAEAEAYGRTVDRASKVTLDSNGAGRFPGRDRYEVAQWDRMVDRQKELMDQVRAYEKAHKRPMPMNEFTMLDETLRKKYGFSAYEAPKK